MRRFRFHLGTLVILVLLVGVGFAALRESNDSWDSSIFSITLGVLLISILFAIHRTDKRRAFWIGFALFGSVYLGLSLVPSIESRLITTRALTFLDSKMPRSIRYDSDGETGPPYRQLLASDSAVYQQGQWHIRGRKLGGWIEHGMVRENFVGSSGTTEHFVRIGHSLLALIAAFLGGQLSRQLYARNRE